MLAWEDVLTMMAGWAMALGFKHLVQRARPVVADPVSQSPGFSFPSGHAANAAIIATALVLLLWPLLGPRGRRLAVVLAAMWVLVTCVDRVMLGVCLVVGAAVWVLTKRWWMVVTTLLAIWLQSMVFVTSAWVVGRDRPTVEKLDEPPPTASYPSGHESASTALYVTFILLALRIRHPGLRWGVVTVCVAMQPWCSSRASTGACTTRRTWGWGRQRAGLRPAGMDYLRRDTPTAQTRA